MEKGLVEYEKCENGTIDIIVTDNKGNQEGNYNYGCLSQVKQDFPTSKYQYINLAKCRKFI